MQNVLPYIVTILCSLISGITSFLVARRQSKSDLEKVQKQFELDAQAEKERFKQEKEKIEIEHKNQIDLLYQQASSDMAKDIMGSMFTEILKNPAVQKEIQKGISKNTGNNK